MILIGIGRIAVEYLKWSEINKIKKYFYLF